MRTLFIEAGHELTAESVRTTVEFEGLSLLQEKRVVYEICGPDAPRQNPNGNFALAAALPTAMALGRPLHVRGEVDADFLATMEEYMAAWCRWRPDLFQPVGLSADVETAARPSLATNAIMAFSGGLDSTFALHAHKHGSLGRRGLNIEAAVLVQGFDMPLDDAAAFDVARTHVEAILAPYGVRLNVVRTNWQKPFSIKWEMTHMLGIAAVLHQFHRTFGKGLVADDFAYDNQRTPWSSNAITNQMLGCGAFPIRTTGAAWGRTEKAAAVAANPIALEHLRVCYERPGLGGNCGECEKCLRTKLNFYANGIRQVPILGRPLTVEDVRWMNPQHADFYIDALEKGTWPANDPMRSELAALVGQFKAGSLVSNSKPRPPRRNFLQRAGKRARPLIRAIRSALPMVTSIGGRPLR